LSDLLRAETGESAREHIRRALIEQRSAGWQRRPRMSARSPTRLASSSRSTSPSSSSKRPAAHPAIGGRAHPAYPRIMDALGGSRRPEPSEPQPERERIARFRT
jgi:hypothetical protein